MPVLTNLTFVDVFVFVVAVAAAAGTVIARAH